jgi:hypothetical protein
MQVSIGGDTQEDEKGQDQRYDGEEGKIKALAFGGWGSVGKGVHGPVS